MDPNTFDDSFSKLYDIDLLYRNFKSVKKVSGWKTPTQRLEEDIVFQLSELSNSIKNGTYIPTPPQKFIINERGKIRCIESYCVEDRVVQSTFTKEILLPLCLPYLIYDNAASLPNRGTKFFRKRLEIHLKDYIKNYGTEGYILLGDFTKFFDNIWHSTFLDALDNFGASNNILDFTKMLLKQHEIDVSYMTDEEYSNCMYVPFNSVKYLTEIDKKLLTGEKFMKKSMGIGSYDAQIAGIVAPYKIDNYIKIVNSIKGYGRYMDDFYIIHKDKEFLKELLFEIQEMAQQLGFILNLNKTQIVKITHPFTILKVKYLIKEDGTIIKVPHSDTFKRERKKLKKFKKKLDNKQMTAKEIYNQYCGWKMSIVHEYGEYTSIKTMDNFYDEIFDTKVPQYMIFRKNTK